MYTRFWPNRCPRNAVSGMTTTLAMTKPVVTQGYLLDRGPERGPRRCGTARSRSDASMVPISVPRSPQTVTHHMRARRDQRARRVEPVAWFTVSVTFWHADGYPRRVLDSV